MWCGVDLCRTKMVMLCVPTASSGMAPMRNVAVLSLSEGVRWVGMNGRMAVDTSKSTIDRSNVTVTVSFSARYISSLTMLVEMTRG